MKHYNPKDSYVLYCVYRADLAMKVGNRWLCLKWLAAAKRADHTKRDHSAIAKEYVSAVG